MRKKKLIALCMALTLGLSALMTGCGSKGNEDKKNDTKKEDTIDESGKVNGVMNATGLPIVDPGSYSFTLFSDTNTKPEEFIMMPEFEKQTGVKVELQVFPFEIATEKFGLALSSGDYADSISGWCLSEADMMKYSEMGTFIPLEDIFEKYCPNIMKVLELEGVREAFTLPDGHIYSIPYVLEAPEVDFNPYINKRWLDNLNLEVPTTTEELRTVLKAFKEQDANGNGDKNDEIPFSVDPNNKKLGYMCGYFGESVDLLGFTMHGEELTFAANTEAYKEGMKYFNSLYKEGLMDVETFTQDIATFKAKGNQDLYGVVFAYGSGDVFPFDPGQTPDFVPLPVLKSENCDKPVWLRNSDGTSMLRSQAVITDNAKNPEVIARWWDNIFEAENSIQLDRGPLDIKVFKEGDGYRAIDDLKLSDEDREKYNWAKMWPQSSPKHVPIGFRPIEDNAMYREKDFVDEAYAPYLTEKKVPPYWVLPEVSTELTDLQTVIREYLAEKSAAWVSGQTDIESDWATYLKDLDGLGLQRYIEIRKEAIGQ